MKLNQLIVLFVGLSLTSTSFGQDGEKQKVKLSNINISMGGLGFSGNYLDDERLRQSFSNNEIWSQFLADTNEFSNFQNGFYSNWNSHFAIDAYFDFCKKENRTHSFSLGIDHASFSLGNTLYSYTTTTPYDTLTSQNTGETYAVDSIYSLNYGVRMNTSTVGLRLGYHYSVEYADLVKFSVGMGYTMRFALNPELEFTRGESTAFTTNSNSQSSQSYGYSNNYPDFNDSRNSVLSRTTLTIHQFYVPIRIESRLSKKENLWSNIALGVNADLGLLMMNSPATGPSTAANMSLRTGLTFHF